MSERTIKIGGFQYRLRFVSSHSLDGKFGQCNFYSTTIDVNAQADPEQQRATIVHEVIEALNYHFELNLKHRQIQSLEHGIHQVLTDNPDLLEHTNCELYTARGRRQ